MWLALGEGKVGAGGEEDDGGGGCWARVCTRWLQSFQQYFLL